MEFEKSRTWANLMSAFAGESQARTKYENYARKASEQGYEQIAAIFRATAANELAHASIWLEALHEGALPDTLVNLQDAAQGEHFEWSSMYKDYAEIAREEKVPRTTSNRASQSSALRIRGVADGIISSGMLASLESASSAIPRDAS